MTDKFKYIIIIVFLIMMIIAMFLREGRITKMSAYNVTSTHYMIHEENQKYIYCPYCGEKLE